MASEFKKNSLHIAVIKNDLDSINRILNGDKFNEMIMGEDLNKKTPLFYAVEKKNYKAAEALLGAGANPNVEYFTGTSLLQYVLEKGDVKMAELLIEKGANPGSRSFKDKPPIFSALEKRNYQILDLLLSKTEGRIDAKFLKLAIFKNDLEAVKVFVENGAKIRATDETTSESALDYAKSLEDIVSQKIIAFLENPKVKKADELEGSVGTNPSGRSLEVSDATKASDVSRLRTDSGVPLSPSGGASGFGFQ